MDDPALWVARTLAGDNQAFAEIYDTYGSPIYDFCRSILRDDSDAADAAQDTFVIAHQKLDTLRDPEKLRAWLYSIARHQSLRRIEQRRRAVSDERVVEVTDESIDLDAGLSDLDAANLVWDAAAGLSPKDRLVLDLHLRHGLAGQELADSLEVTRQNAYVLLDKMKKALSRAAGALLVARYNRRDCEDLSMLLTDWDGYYDPLVRKRVARHIESCDVCKRNKAALVAPDRLFSVVPMVAAPAALRSRVLEAIGSGRSTDHGQGPTVLAESTGSTRAKRATLGVLGVTTALAVVVVLAIVMTSGGSVESEPTPGSVTTIAPSATETAVPSTTAGSTSSAATTSLPTTTTETSSTTTTAAPTTSAAAPTSSTTTSSPTTSSTTTEPVVTGPGAGSGPGSGG